MKRDRRIIAIAGAGIAGMTAALFLERAGFRVLLFEKSPQTATTGTGIQISPNAYKVLAELGLSRSLNTVGFVPDSIDIGCGLTGDPLTQFSLGETCLKRHGAPYTVIHRVDLAHILQTACEDREDIDIHRGTQVADLAAHANGLTLLCEAEQKTTEEYVVSAVIGADGAWSTLRKYVHDSETPQFTGQIAWRALIDIQNTNPALSRTATGLWLGPNTHLVHYPVRAGSLLNVVAITPWTKDYAPRRGWVAQSALDDRTTAYEGWLPHLRELVGTRADWGGWPIFATAKAGKFANGPLCLIGDAAHSMVPYAAQGGACAIEDAYVLASLCSGSADDLTAAFDRFEKIRRPRVQKIMRLSDNNRRIYHLKTPYVPFRDAIMKLSPQASLQKRMDWMYGWESQREQIGGQSNGGLATRISKLWRGSDG
ncbi:MAG: FAD-binding protein [Rhizobiaceae bacterium]|nr:FAD-binding protein [Rhizobiaceae bacterium]